MAVTPTSTPSFSREKALKFLRMAISHAQEFSKDESTKVGALAISPDTYEIRSLGYNGMPRGCDDANPARKIRPEKYFWFEHAERNAIYNAARAGTSLDGCVMAVSLYPCMDCARGLVQTGFSGVISICPDLSLATWGEMFPRSMELFAERGIWTMLFTEEDVIDTAPEELRPAFVSWFEAGRARGRG